MPRADGGAVETDHRKIWQIFADNFYLFRGTPSGSWLKQELIEVFGIDEKLSSETAQPIYDQIAAKLASPDFAPRKLFEQLQHRGALHHRRRQRHPRGTTRRSAILAGPASCCPPSAPTPSSIWMHPDGKPTSDALSDAVGYDSR